MSEEFASIQEVVEAARRNLDDEQWAILTGGSESETTMRRNRLGFDRLAFRPRILIDVSSVDTSTTLLGHKLRIPVILAPVGGLQRYTADGSGAAASTRAASQFGIIHCHSSVSEPSPEVVAANSTGPRLFQLYIRGDWPWVVENIQRVKAAGYGGLIITVDLAVGSRRERVILGRWRRIQPQTQERRYGAEVTWDTIDRIKAELGGLPLALKGIATAEDAALAVEHGVDVVWVSNHGGRQLDHGQATIDILPEVVEAVNGRAEIVLDGGIQRGTDVLKAVALGAKAVAIGKLQGWALAAGGEAALLRTLELLEEEIQIDMALIGVTSLDQLRPEHLTRVAPVTFPHEMSSWTHIAGGRLV